MNHIFKTNDLVTIKKGCERIRASTHFNGHMKVFEGYTYRVRYSNAENVELVDFKGHNIRSADGPVDRWAWDHKWLEFAAPEDHFPKDLFKV